MKNKFDSKVCGVCGDKALGYNFNAVTCESCKAFFRRNALINKEFRCPFTNDCKITTITRRFCQKCRLDKCFAIGMCKDLIMSEEDKAQKRQKIEENRAKKRHLDSPSGSSSSSNKKIKNESVEPDSQDSSSCNTDSDQDPTVSDGYQPNVPNVNNNSNKTVTNEDFITSSTERLVSSSDDSVSLQNILTQHFYKIAAGSPLSNFSQFDPALLSGFINNNTINLGYNSINHATFPPAKEDVAKDVLRDVERLNSHHNSRTLSGSIESILSEAIKLEYSCYSSIAQGSSSSRELNDAEKTKLNELILANRALLTPVEEELSLIENEFKDVVENESSRTEKQQTDPALLDVINLTALGIRRLIKMAKKINAFKNMCQEDQVALLKGGCTEIMMIISARRYDSSKNSWKIPSIQESYVNVNVLKLAKGNAYQELEQFIRTFDPKWRSDENIILILCAIVLFTPDRPRVIHQDVIRLEQNSYYYLLRRYLESIYEGCEAKSIFLKLIQKIMELHKVNEELINVLLDVNPCQVEPLLIEIFDLK
ncbi:hypothetical protein ABEB36_010312 [Hypothenemus hampei]|uniref:Nuclear hormone receptor HR96 n=1 Tax=Hypothenemus hampei TaxID=57062 RepID=A0ABD1EJ78_HYPHA